MDSKPGMAVQAMRRNSSNPTAAAPLVKMLLTVDRRITISTSTISMVVRVDSTHRLRRATDSIKAMGARSHLSRDGKWLSLLVGCFWNENVVDGVRLCELDMTRHLQVGFDMEVELGLYIPYTCVKYLEHFFSLQ